MRLATVVAILWAASVGGASALSANATSPATASGTVAVHWYSYSFQSYGPWSFTGAVTVGHQRYVGAFTGGVSSSSAFTWNSPGPSSGPIPAFALSGAAGGHALAGTCQGTWTDLAGVPASADPVTAALTCTVAIDGGRAAPLTLTAALPVDVVQQGTQRGIDHDLRGTFSASSAA